MEYCVDRGRRSNSSNPSSYHLRDDLAMASMVPIQVFELLYIYYSCLLIAL